MKHVLVVDDEGPVVDHLCRIIDRDLTADFAVVGTASSGREALEKVPLLRPDIIVMDIKMPGLSGLETIRELKHRGVAAAFLLSTAYERFDIAREALELGIIGYLLKPVTRDALVQGLRSAADQVDRRTALELQESDLREKNTRVRALAVQAFLDGLVLGRSSGGAVAALRDWLGIDKPWGLVAVAAFDRDPAAGRDALESVLQYKSTALCGALVADRCPIFLPLASAEAAAEAGRALVEAVGTVCRIGCSDPHPLEDLGSAWPEALDRLGGRRAPAQGRFAVLGDFEEEEAFHAALVNGDSDRLRTSLGSLLLPFEGAGPPPVADRYRIIALLGSALGRLVSLGLLDEDSAHLWMDFDDLRQASSGQEFCLVARTRLPVITGALSRGRRLSTWVSQAIEFIARNYGQPLTLDLAADHVGLTPKRLSRLFIEELGQGFTEYLIDFRIEKAKALLALPGASIKQVSISCGYPDPNYFARLFKKVTGTTPSEFASP
jgi:two-component system response regulator YesN